MELSELWNKIITGTLGLNDSSYNILDHVLRETSLPYGIDALIILSYKSLDAWYADAIVTASQLVIVCPHLSRDNRVIESGYEVFTNYIGLKFMVSKYLLSHVQQCYMRHSDLFEPVFFPDTEYLPHTLCLQSISKHSDLLRKKIDLNVNDISTCFIESIVDVCNKDLADLSPAEIRRFLVKDDQVSKEMLTAVYHK